jgi:hypothetical protein
MQRDLGHPNQRRFLLELACKLMLGRSSNRLQTGQSQKGTRGSW